MDSWGNLEYWEQIMIISASTVSCYYLFKLFTLPGPKSYEEYMAEQLNKEG